MIETHESLPRRAVSQLRVKPYRLVVYLSVISVSITLTSNVLEVLEVLDVVVGGGGSSALPPVGILPAKIGLESAHMSANAIASRFMDFAPLRFRKMPRFWHKKERERMELYGQDFLQGRRERITIAFAFAQLLANRKSQNPCGRPLRIWIRLTLLRTKKPNSDAAQQ
jgi:hypothetical protein